MSLPPKSDPQRDKVYWLEAEINGTWNIDAASRSSLTYALGKLSRHYRVPEPGLKIVSKKGGDSGWYEDETIVLNRAMGGANLHVLIHEFAHYVTDCYYEDVENHGPEFAAIYMYLLDKYSILPHECFRLLARKHRVRIGRRFRPRAFR